MHIGDDMIYLRDGTELRYGEYPSIRIAAGSRQDPDGVIFAHGLCYDDGSTQRVQADGGIENLREWMRGYGFSTNAFANLAMGDALVDLIKSAADIEGDCLAAYLHTPIITHGDSRTAVTMQADMYVTQERRHRRSILGR